MAENTEVSILFKIFKKIEVNDNGDFVGNKDNAEIINTGYIYIFRKIMPEESNDDGTVTRIYTTINLEQVQSYSLPEKSLGNYSVFFFAYSKIELQTSRVETIRKSLDKFITLKNSLKSGMGYSMGNSKEYIDRIKKCRATHIPLTNRSIPMTNRYLINPAKSTENVFFTERDSKSPNYISDNANYNSIIYLYDWISYLEALTEEYNISIGKYDDVIKTEMDISKYENELKSKYGSDRYPAKLYNFDSKIIKNEKYSIENLYPITLQLDSLVNIKKQKYRDGMRFNYSPEANTPLEVDEFNMNQCVRKYEYKECLNEMNSLIDPVHAECQIKIDKIIDLYTENSRRVHSSLIDYSFGTDKEREFAEKLVGLSLKNSSIFLGEEKAIKFKELIVKKTLLENGDKFSDTSDLSVLQPEDILDKTGEADYFTFSFVFETTKTIVTETTYILDSFLQNMKDLTSGEIIKSTKYLQDGRYKKLTGLGKIVSMDENRAKAYCRRHSITVTDNNALGTWSDGMLDQYPGIDVETKIIDNVETKIASWTEFNLRTKTYPSALKANLQNIAGLTTLLLKALDGFNILYKATCFKDTTNTADSLLVVSSMLGSLTGLLSNRIEKALSAKALTTEASSAFVGSTGFLFLAIEAGINASKRHRENDRDAEFYYELSAIAGITGFICGALTIGTVPGLLFFSITAMLSMLGVYFTDDHIDILIKHTVWGCAYREMPKTIPCWWPENKTDQETFIHTGDYTPKSPLTLTKNITNQLSGIRNLLQIPVYNTEKGQEQTLFSVYSYRDTLFFELTNISDTDEIETIELRLLAEDDKLIFTRNYNPRVTPENFRSGTKKVNIENEIQDINTFRVLFVQTKNRVARAIQRVIKPGVLYTPLQQSKNLKNLPEHYQKTLESLGRNIDMNQNLSIEYIVRYYTPLRLPVKTLIK